MALPRKKTSRKKTSSRKRGEAAQILPIMAIFLGMSAGVFVVVSALGDRAVRIAQADAAADAAALAAASGDEAEAVAVAQANGYELLSLDWKTVSSRAPDARQTRSYCKVEARVRESASSAAQGRFFFGSVFSRPLVSSSASAASNRLCPSPSAPSETS